MNETELTVSDFYAEISQLCTADSAQKNTVFKVPVQISIHCGLRTSRTDNGHDVFNDIDKLIDKR